MADSVILIRLSLYSITDWKTGYPSDGPYEVIHVGAAVPAMPSVLVEQLALGGRMFVPIGVNSQEILLIDKDESGNVQEKKLMGVRVSFNDHLPFSGGN
jgi:protein-L-isoaspartate(D-aspartate) O-methyltransferase